ncbi:hypothetical protein SDC9_135520 [bioreactor metagenome]|uniref:Uncharacterized protein n=1 Tax=bioreactor metagenome TaxID=1076179 RepID=A0A645DGF1_9ZZZZ
MGQSLVFLLLNLAGGDFRPQLNDPGQVFHGQIGGAVGLQPLQLRAQLILLALNHGQALIRALAGLGQHDLALPAEIRQLLTDLHHPGQRLVL